MYKQIMLKSCKRLFTKILGQKKIFKKPFSLPKMIKIGKGRQEKHKIYLKIKIPKDFYKYMSLIVTDIALFPGIRQ